MPFQHINSKRSWFWILIGVTSAIVGFASYLSWKGAESKSGSSLPLLGKVPDFVFSDQNARRIGTDQLKGKIWVADFICIGCGGVYPILSSRFAELDRNFAKSDALILVSFVVDPEHSTRTIVEQYARGYEASERWHFLSGDEKQIEDFVAAGLPAGTKIDRGKDGEAADDAGRFGMTTLVLVDGDGVIRSYYDGVSPEVVARLLTDLGSLLRASKN
jgi:protein SCO1/2